MTRTAIDWPSTNTTADNRRQATARAAKPLACRCGNFVSCSSGPLPHPRLLGLAESYTGTVLSGFPAGIHIGTPGLTVPLILTLRDHPVLLAGRAGSGDSTSYSSLVSGLRTAPVFIIQNGSAATLTIELSLAGVRYLLGIPAATLARLSVPATSVLGPSVEALTERVELADSWSTAFALVDDYLLSRLPDHPIGHGLVDAAWRMIRSGQGNVRVSTIADQLDCSERTLHAKLHREGGLGPKALSRITRFNTARSLVHRRLMHRRHSPTLTQIAAECGYYDEAHLLREWNSFTGTTPTRWRTDDETAFHESHEGG